MIGESEIAQFEEVGAVTIDTPFSKARLDRVSGVFDRMLPFEGRKMGNRPSIVWGNGIFSSLNCWI